MTKLTDQLPDEQYTIPYDDVNGSNMSNMLANMTHFNKIAKDLHSGDIDEYKQLLKKLHARYKPFLYKWLKQNWDSLNQEQQDFAKPYYRTGRIRMSPSPLRNYIAGLPKPVLTASHASGMQLIME